MPFADLSSPVTSRLVWALLLGVWFCTACTRGQFIVPPAAARAETDLPAGTGCTPEVMFADVGTDRARLRSAPNLEGEILKLLRRGEVYPVVGLNPDATWVQLQVQGVAQQAWVYAELVRLVCPWPVLPAGSRAEAGDDAALPAAGSPLVELFLQKLEELAAEPESDGGIPYARALYVPETSAVDTRPCDASCAAIRDSRLADRSWFLPYENRYTFDRSSVRAVHLLPLYELHRSGGWNWSVEQQTRYGAETAAPDSGLRVLVSPETLAARGFADPGGWLPRAGPGRCAYVMDWIRQKTVWRLSVDAREKEALTAALSACHDIALTRSPATPGRPAAAPESATIPVAVTCDARQEVVSIVNRSGDVLNLQNWYVHEEGNHQRFQLPPWPLGVDGAVSLGFGQAAAADIQLTTVSVWNNSGDTVYLYDDRYDLIVAQPCGV